MLFALIILKKENEIEFAYSCSLYLVFLLLSLIDRRILIFSYRFFYLYHFSTKLIIGVLSGKPWG